LISLTSGDLLLTTRNYDDGAGINVDSLTPGVPQIITIVTGRPFRFLARSNFIVQITTGGTMVGSFAGIVDGESFNMTFTPIAPTATITITQSTAGGPDTLQLNGIYLPRVDSFVSENVVTLVCNEDKYHYGYNGQMKVNEIAGLGNHNTALNGELDTRTGRRWNLDPKPNASVSPYSMFGNSPIWHNDVLLDSPGTGLPWYAGLVYLLDKMGHSLYESSKQAQKEGPTMNAVNNSMNFLTQVALINTPGASGSSDWEGEAGAANTAEIDAGMALKNSTPEVDAAMGFKSNAPDADRGMGLRSGSERTTNDPLPRDEHGVATPESEYPHTQIGTEQGSKGPYKQAREWKPDGQGGVKPKKDIDFTDHGRPGNHTNPHQHNYEPNPTGGTEKRGKAVPFTTEIPGI